MTEIKVTARMLAEAEQKRPRDEHDRHMDALLNRINKEVQDENRGDVMSVCAAMIGWALHDVREDDREETLMNLYKFIIKVCAEADDLEPNPEH